MLLFEERKDDDKEKEGLHILAPLDLSLIEQTLRIVSRSVCSVIQKTHFTTPVVICNF